jgi:hypothetical protein
MDPTGHQVRRLTEGNVAYCCPVFLDSKTVVFPVGRLRCWPYSTWDRISVDGRGRRRFATGIDGLELPPNRLWIALYTPAERLYVMRADGVDRRRPGSIINPSADGELVSEDAYSYAWSPDGTMLAFEASSDAQGVQVYVVRLPNGRPRQLSRLPATASGPVWSPNGRQLEYSTWTYDPSNVLGTSRDVLIRPDGSHRRIFPGQENGTIIAWLPNGDRLSEGDKGVELVRSDGSIARHLLSQSNPGTDPSPDGTAAIYEQEGGRAPWPPGCPDPGVGPPPHYTRIDIVNLRTGTTHPLTQPQARAHVSASRPGSRSGTPAQRRLFRREVPRPERRRPTIPCPERLRGSSSWYA